MIDSGREEEGRQSRNVSFTPEESGEWKQKSSTTIEHFSNSTEQDLFGTSTSKSPLEYAQLQKQPLESEISSNNSNDEKSDENEFGDLHFPPLAPVEMTGQPSSEGSPIQETTNSSAEMEEIHNEIPAYDVIYETSHEQEKLKNEEVVNCPSEDTVCASLENNCEDQTGGNFGEEENAWADFTSTVEGQFQSSKQKDSPVKESAIDESEVNERENYFISDDSRTKNNDNDDDFRTFGEPFSTETESLDQSNDENSQIVSPNDQNLPLSSENVFEVQNELVNQETFGFANFSSAGDDSDWADFGGTIETSEPASQTVWPSASFNDVTSQRMELKQQSCNETHGDVTSTLEDSFDDFGEPVEASVTSLENHVTPFSQNDDDFEDFADFSTGDTTNESSREDVDQQQMNGYVSSVAASDGKDNLNYSSVGPMGPYKPGVVMNDSSSSCVYSPCTYACIEDLLDEIDCKATTTAINNCAEWNDPLISEEPLLLQDFFASMSITSHLSKQISEEVEVAWALVANIGNSSSLLFDCEDSLLNQQLLASLGVDISNALCAVKQNLPKYAAQLGLLQPVKSVPSAIEGGDSNLVTPSGVGVGTGGDGGTGVNKSDGALDRQNRQRQILMMSNNNNDPHMASKCQTQTAPDAVPDVEFDWGTSGLKNPLEIPSLSLDFFDSQFNSFSAASASTQLEEELLNACGGTFDGGGEAGSSSTSSGSRRTGGGDSRLASILAAAQSSTAQESVSVVVGNTFRAMPTDDVYTAAEMLPPNISDLNMVPTSGSGCHDVEALGPVVGGLANYTSTGAPFHQMSSRRSGFASSIGSASIDQPPNGAKLFSETAPHGSQYSHYAAQHNNTNTAKNGTGPKTAQDNGRDHTNSSGRGASSFTQRYCVPPMGRSNSTGSTQPVTSSSSSKWSRWFSRK